MGRKAKSHKSNVCKLFELVLSEGTLAYMILLFSIVKVRRYINFHVRYIHTVETSRLYLTDFFPGIDRK